MIGHPPRSPFFPYPTLFRSPPPFSSAPGRLALPLAIPQHEIGRDGLRFQHLQHPDHLAAVEAKTVSTDLDRKSTRLNSSHTVISYAVFCLKNKKIPETL